MQSESLFKKCVSCSKLSPKSASQCVQCGKKFKKFSNTQIILSFTVISLLLLGNLENFAIKKKYPNNDKNFVSNTQKPNHPDISKPNDKWQQNNSISKIDDSNIIELTLAADNEIQGWLTDARPKLTIRCKEHSTDLFIIMQMSASIEDAHDLHTVEIRLDKGKVFSQLWTSSTDNNALFAPKAIDLAKKMAKSEKVVIRFTPFNADPQIIEFTVVGLSNYLGLLAKTCNWSL